MTKGTFRVILLLHSHWRIKRVTTQIITVWAFCWRENNCLGWS